MKELWKWVGIAGLVAIVGLAAVGGVAYAQDEEGTSPFDFMGNFKEALAGILGVSVEEYDAAVTQAQEQVVHEAVTDGWLTEEQAELWQWRMEHAPGGGKGDMPFGLRGLDHGIGKLGDGLLSIAAEQLDLSLTELLTELQDGQSISSLAKDRGVDAQAIADAYLAGLQAELDEAVADGDMTQKQADYALEQAGARVTEQLDATGLGGMRGPGGRRGGMMGLPGMVGF